MNDAGNDLDVKEEPAEGGIQKTKSKLRGSKTEDVSLKGVGYVIETGPVVLIRNANNDYVNLSSFSDKQYVDTFGIDRAQFQMILESLSEFHETSSIKPSLEMFCAISLYALSSVRTFEYIAQVFNVTTNTVIKTLCIFCSFVSSSMIHKVDWPRDDHLVKTIDTFKDYNLGNIVGIINTCRFIVDEKFVENNHKQLFWDDERGCYTVKLLAVCCKDHKFSYIQLGFPASWSNEDIYKRSDLGEVMITDSVDFIPLNSRLVGDSTFPLEKQLMTPYFPCELGGHQAKFNERIRDLLMIFDEAFDMLINRFNRLTELPNVLSESNFINLVLTCLILHNICLEKPKSVDLNSELYNHSVDSVNVMTRSSSEDDQIRNLASCESNNQSVNDEEGCPLLDLDNPTAKRDSLARTLIKFTTM